MALEEAQMDKQPGTQQDKQPETQQGRLKPLPIILGGLLLLGGLSYLVFSLLGQGLVRQQEAALRRALTVEALPAREEFRVQVAPDDLSIREGLNPDWHNVLLLGTDERGGILNEGRSDAILVMSLNTRTGEIKLTSLVRDLLVPIPGASGNDKIAHANQYGGPLLAIKTVNEALDLNIAHYVSVDFRGFVNVVNTLGGVELPLDEKLVTLFKLEEGQDTYRLDGTLALRFVRVRRYDNNFARNERQRQFLSAMLDQARRQDQKKVMAAFAESLKAMSTNLSVNDLMMMAQQLLGRQLSPSLLSLPPAGQYSYGKGDSETRGVVARLDNLAAAFHNFVYQGQLPEAAQQP